MNSELILSSLSDLLYSLSSIVSGSLTFSSILSNISLLATVKYKNGCTFLSFIGKSSEYYPSILSTPAALLTRIIYYSSGVLNLKA
jgi:hypothetical protein